MSAVNKIILISSVIYICQNYHQTFIYLNDVSVLL